MIFCFLRTMQGIEAFFGLVYINQITVLFKEINHPRQVFFSFSVAGDGIEDQEELLCHGVTLVGIAIRMERGLK